MQSFHYVMIAQAAVALFGAFYFTRRLRGFIRATVVRLMPVKHRISDASFNLQTRYSALTAYLLGLLLTGFFYWGINKVVDRLLPGAVTQQTLTHIEPIPPAPAPIPAPPVLPDGKAGEEAVPPISKTTPVQDYDVPAPVNRREIDTDGHYYIQLYAFINVDRALTQQAVYEDRLTYPVAVRKVNGTIGPYKVIIGPFVDRSTAARFLQREGLTGIVLEENRLR